MVVAFGINDESCNIRFRIADGARDMQVLDGGAIDESERCYTFFDTGVVEGQFVACTVEVTFEAVRSRTTYRAADSEKIMGSVLLIIFVVFE